MRLLLSQVRPSFDILTIDMLWTTGISSARSGLPFFGSQLSCADFTELHTLRLSPFCACRSIMECVSHPFWMSLVREGVTLSFHTSNYSFRSRLKRSARSFQPGTRRTLIYNTPIRRSKNWLQLRTFIRNRRFVILSLQVFRNK